MRTRAVTAAGLWVLVICCGHALVAGQNRTTGFAFPSFPAEDSRISTELDVKFNEEASSYDLNFYGSDHHCGRILYKDKVRLKDKATNTAASFSTSFTFSFISYDSFVHCGDGMVFTFASVPFGLLLDTKRAFCSFDYVPEGTERVFAVKFDSYRSPSNDTGLDYFDPSDGSIGVIVNNGGALLPIPQYNLCAGSSNTTNCDYFCGEKGDFSAWIDYDSPTQTLEVRFRNGSLTSGVKPAAAVLTVPNLALGDVLDEEMYVALTGKSFWQMRLGLPLNPETHRVTSWYFNSSGVSLSDPELRGTLVNSAPPAPGVIAGACAGAVGVILYMYFAYTL